MTKEDKKLLFRYLSMALSYGIKCNIGLEFPLKLQRISVDMFDGILLDFFLTDINYQVYLSEVKPYLKPLSSMTEEEDFTTCTNLSDWKSKHLEVSIINIETISKSPSMYRVWYRTQNRNRNL